MLFIPAARRGHYSNNQLALHARVATASCHYMLGSRVATTNTRRAMLCASVTSIPVLDSNLSIAADLIRTLVTCLYMVLLHNQ